MEFANGIFFVFAIFHFGSHIYLSKKNVENVSKHSTITIVFFLFDFFFFTERHTAESSRASVMLVLAIPVHIAILSRVREPEQEKKNVKQNQVHRFVRRAIEMKNISTAAKCNSTVYLLLSMLLLPSARAREHPLTEIIPSSATQCAIIRDGFKLRVFFSFLNKDRIYRKVASTRSTLANSSMIN